MLIIFMFLLIPSIFHVTTSKALNNNHNNNNSFTIININNSKQHDSTPSSFLPVSGTIHTILQSIKSKLKVNTNDKLKSEPPVSNRYRRNANNIMEKSLYDPNYDLVVDDERNSSPPTSSPDWDDTLLSRNRRNLIRRTPLSEEFSGMQILNSVNLSGRREQPFFVEEPQYISVRQEAEYPELIETEAQNELFIPPRGRKSQRIEKKGSLNNLFSGQNSDLFMPNRGKKMDEATDYYKRAKYNDLVFGEDLFFPNRGKKLFTRTKLAASTSPVTQLLGSEDFFYPNRGKKSRFASILAENELFYPNRGKRYSSDATAGYIGGGDLTDLDFFVPNRGKKTLLINKREILLNDKKQGNKSTTTTATPTNIINNNSKDKNNNNNNDNKGDRYKRDLLDNLSKEKDTFYSARGRRNNNNNNNNNSINNNGERNNDNNNNNNNLNEKFMEGNNKNFLDDKFYTSNEILKRSLIKNFKNDYGITDNSRIKTFHFVKQIPTMYGMAGADKMPTTRLDQQITKQEQEAILSSLINKDAAFGEGGRDLGTNTDFHRFILPRYFGYMDNNAQSNYKK